MLTADPKNCSLIVFAIIEARILSFLNDNAAGGTTEKRGRTTRVIKGIKAVVWQTLSVSSVVSPLLIVQGRNQPVRHLPICCR